MRISDWSSDVCSSDLGNARRAGAQAVAGMSAYFVYPFAAFCEIAGCFAFWAWWRLDRSALWLLPGLVVLALFAWLLAQVPTDEAGRAYAAYGGVYVAASLLWLWTVEGTHARSLGCDRRCGGARRRGHYPVRPARLIPQSRSSYLSRLRLDRKSTRLN